MISNYTKDLFPPEEITDRPITKLTLSKPPDSGPTVCSYRPELFDRIETDSATGDKIGYFYSNVLEKQAKINLRTGRVCIKDRDKTGSLVQYSPAEMEILSKSCGITPQLHNLKKAFMGTIIE